jgi:hypothetical protein
VNGVWKRLRAQPTRTNERDDAVFTHWLVLMGVLVFVGYVLWTQGTLQWLNASDPTGISQLIVGVFVTLLLWSGFRAWRLMKEMQAPATQTTSWLANFQHAINEAPAQRDAITDLLTERASGAHETAWWFNGLLLKLGLLGTVVGFMLMSLTVANFEVFDVEKAQALLRSMTRGMGVALLTTLVALIGNMIVGWQLLQLDRAADRLVTRAVSQSVTKEKG